MINLNFLILLPIVFISLLLVLSTNNKLNFKSIESNSLKHVYILEENEYMMPYILHKYYSHLVNVNLALFPSLRTTSFSRQNLKWSKDKGVLKKNGMLMNALKKLGLFLSITLYALILIFWFKYSRVTISYQLLTNVESNSDVWNLDIILGLDGVSLPFFLLTGFILPLVFISNWSTINKLDIYYIIIIILLELFLIIVFLVIDLIMFYIFFESILPLLFILIGLYGAKQKFRAGYYLFLYTFKMSLGNSCLCTRTKFRGSPKALVTNIIKETWWLASLMIEGMVISLGMTEIKWVIADLNQTMFVKEQRVDGSSAFNKNAVRCTLVAGKPVLERKKTFFYYHLQNLRSFCNIAHILYNNNEEKLEIKKTLLIINKLDPWFITGFTDGEGCFFIDINKNNEYKIGYQVQTIFQISLHNKDLELLSKIQSYFGGWRISKHGKNSIYFRITSLKNLKALIFHFDKYNLISQKWADYVLFKRVLDLIENKKHLTVDGFKEILSIKASMNLGLPNRLKTIYSDIVPVVRPEIVDNNIKDPNWIAGFTNGEGCFFVYIIDSSTCKLGKAVRMKFQLTQHIRDQELMKNLVVFFTMW